jgi:hypothetical protein
VSTPRVTLLARRMRICSSVIMSGAPHVSCDTLGKTRSDTPASDRPYVA